MKNYQFPYSLIPAGYGHYSFIIQFRGKEYKTVTNNMRAVDDYHSEEGERDPHTKALRVNQGATALRNEAIRKHNLR